MATERSDALFVAIYALIHDNDVKIVFAFPFDAADLYPLVIRSAFILFGDILQELIGLFFGIFYIHEFLYDDDSAIVRLEIGGWRRHSRLFYFLECIMPFYLRIQELAFRDIHDPQGM